MALDPANYIDELSITDPTASDDVSEGDDQIRTVKRAVKQSFPSVDIAVNAIHTSATEPAVSVAEGLVWIDTSGGAGNHVAKIYDGSAFIILPFSVETAKTVDIDGGAIDGTIIGGSSAAAGTFAALEGTAVKATTSLTLDTSATVIFEGSTADAYETTLTVTDPTADRTVTIQNATDTLVGRATADTLTNKTMTSSGNTFDDATTSAKGMASFSSDNFGTSSGAVTIKDGGVANAELADMAANTVKVRNANSSGAPSDVALATTEILIGDGTGFAAAPLSGDATMTNAGAVTVAKLQGYDVSSTAPTNDYVLKYSTGTSKWEPAAFAYPDKLTTKGDLLAYNSVSSETRFPIAGATNGEVLTADSSATNGFDWAAATVADGSITNAKMADMAANTVKVRNANSSGVPSDLALATTQLMIGDGTGFTAAALSGDVTMANTGAVTIANDAVDIAMLSATGTASATTFLRGDNAWTEVSGGTAWQAVQTVSFTAVAGRGYPINTTGGVITMTLPSSASVGDTIEVIDYAGTFDTNSVLIDPNGLNIKGQSGNLRFKTEREGARIVYVDATQGWVAATSRTGRTLDPEFGATGGTKTTNGAYDVHTFTSSGDLVVVGSGNVEILAVAGGAGGGAQHGGAGGAGGYRYITGVALTTNTYAIVIGAGGAGGAGGTNDGAAGSASTGLTYSSAGGGYGGAYPGHVGGAGGSGGGGGTDNVAGGAGNTPSTTPAQGFAGGSSTQHNTGGGGGGGGGSSAVGANGGNSSTAGGDGGAGTLNNLDGNGWYWAGGGGGGAIQASCNGGDGGIGGGGGGGSQAGTVGTGDYNNAKNNGGDGVGAIGGAGGANTGGGGGASGNGASDGGAGGSGIVIIRYLN